DDCFSFAESDQERACTLSTSEEGDSVSLLIIQDKEGRNSTRKGTPTIISAARSSKWINKGIDTVKKARLGLLTNMGLELEQLPWSIMPEPILKPGDAVGWKAGTGICHSLLNDAEDDNGS
ncbi:531_t:CDS:2, partial [Acaulospora colombiana]